MLEIIAETEFRPLVVDNKGTVIPNYFISQNGVIVNSETGEWKKSIDNVKNKDLHQRVSINGVSYYLHRLVALAYIPNPNNYPVVRHKDDNPRRNRVDNLEWGTHKDNTMDAIRNGKIKYDENRNYTVGEKHGYHILTNSNVREICDLLLKSVPMKDIAGMFSVSEGVIRHIYNRNTWKCVTKDYPEFPEQRIKRFHSQDIKDIIANMIKNDPNITAKPLLERIGLEFNNVNKCMVFQIKRKVLNDMSSTTIDNKGKLCG